jgi:hypothetical protein
MAYTYAWFVTVPLSFVTYTVLMWGRVDRVAGDGADGRDA